MPDHLKRPGLVQRHSSASVTFAKSPSDYLSGSAQKQKSTRHVVGQGRLGPRIPSYGKNVNKLNKPLTAARGSENSTSPRSSHIQRNSSHAQLTTTNSAAALRKNHSETSLKKNRSSGQLVKLARPGSSRNVNKAGRKLNKRTKSHSTSQEPDLQDPPSVRFDLGEEGAKQGVEGSADGDADGWTNYSGSRSPSTSRSNTQQNSRTASPVQDRDRLHVKEPKPPDDPGQAPPNRASGGSHETEGNGHTAKSDSSSSKRGRYNLGRVPDADRITSRLLRRNTSFNAAPLLSSNAATPVIIDPHGPMSGAQSMLSDGSNPEIISRFLNHGSSSSTLTHDNKYLSKNSPQEDQNLTDDDEPRRNKSMPNFAAMRVSRNEQRLNLEQDSQAPESPEAEDLSRASTLASRLSSTNVPFYPAANGVDGRLHPHARQLFDQTDVEYRRMRMYQDPLKDAIIRLQNSAGIPRPHIPAKPKPGYKTGLLSASSGDGRFGLSSSWKSQKSAKSAESAVTPVKEIAATARRPRVMFQGIKEDDDDSRSKRGSYDGTAEQRELRAQRDEVREICRRLWAKNEIVSTEG